MSFESLFDKLNLPDNFLVKCVSCTKLTRKNVSEIGNSVENNCIYLYIHMSVFRFIS